MKLGDAAIYVGVIAIPCLLLCALILTLGLLVTVVVGGPDCPVDGPRGHIPRAWVEVYETHREFFESDEETDKRCSQARNY